MWKTIVLVLCASSGDEMVRRAYTQGGIFSVSGTEKTGEKRGKMEKRGEKREVKYRENLGKHEEIGIVTGKKLGGKINMNI